MNNNSHSDRPPPSTSWPYSNADSELPINVENGGQTAGGLLQEPVPFEDFQFSFGLDPDFSIPIPLDNVPPPIPMDISLRSEPPLWPGLETNNQLYQQASLDNNNNYNNNNSGVLDENEQKAFTQFLDAFFLDQDSGMANAEQLAGQFANLYDPQPSPLFLNDPFLQPSAASPNNEEHRQNSILQSLDEQKHFSHRLQRLAQQQQQHQQQSSHSPQNSHDAEDNTSVSLEERLQKRRPNKELLTEEEKRSNHIASEQKRRSTIRSGLKDLTDIVPTLRNINHSKSTVLFKAVEYMKYLEKRNRVLRDKLTALEMRARVQGTDPAKRIKVAGRPRTPSLPHDTSTLFVPTPQHWTMRERQKEIDHSSVSPHTTASGGLTTGATAALMAHKSQQKNLFALQEELQRHQKIRGQKLDRKEDVFQPIDRWHGDHEPNETTHRVYRSSTATDNTNTMEVDVEEPLKATVSA